MLLNKKSAASAGELFCFLPIPQIYAD